MRRLKRRWGSEKRKPTPWRSQILLKYSMPFSLSETYSSRSTSFMALRSATSFFCSRPLSNTSIAYTPSSALWSSSSFSSLARPFRPAPKKFEAFEETSPPKRSFEDELQKLTYFCTISSGIAPSSRRSRPSCSFSSWQLRSITRPRPVWPTNMWCASSVSMNRQVRASGSNPDSASDRSWNLPSRSV